MLILICLRIDGYKTLSNVVTDRIHFHGGAGDPKIVSIIA